MPQKKITDYRTDFLEYCEVEKGLRPLSVQNYARFLDKFFHWLKINKLNIVPQNLSEDHIWKYRLWLSRTRDTHSSRPLTPATQAYYLIALRAFLRFFSERNIETLGPEKVKLPKEQRSHTIKFLTLDQVKELIEAPKNSRGQFEQLLFPHLYFEPRLLLK